MDEKKKVILKLQDISKSYIVNNKVVDAVSNVSFEVYDNEFLVLLGPGHCGKSVLLNCIAGIEKPVGGNIQLDGRRFKAATAGSDVFQRLALMPWRTVMGCRAGAGTSRCEKRAAKDRAEYIDLVGLTGLKVLSKRAFRRQKRASALPEHMPTI
jgi:NitT/TauT family transport system ATP-binding protein/sulfonate transport system ATP-binding protein